LRCSSCNAENPDNNRFCGDCGASLPNVCPKCRAENPIGKRFCGACGAATLVPSRHVSAAQLSETNSTTSGIRFRSDEPSAPATSDGERKTITALFADIKGSTELMADLDPEEARTIIDPALQLMIEAVQRYDGYVVQSTGDGIFALFGAPVAHEDHPQRALYAALKLQEELKRYSAKVVAEGSSPIQGRIGINTGEVVVRSIHTGAGQTEYTPIGHTTNLASRMQSAAPVGSVAVSETTRNLCEGYFILKPLGATKVKGVGGPVNVYEVTGLGPLRTRLQRAAGRGLTRFVSRDAELQLMKHALELARTGHGQMVAAVGEPGVGKSRLFFEFKALSHTDSLIVEAYSISHGKASAYLPVIELLRDYFRIVPEDDARQRREKVAGKIVILDRSLEDTLPYLNALLGIAENDAALAQMDREILRRRTYEAIKRVLLRESLNQPLIVIFEDLHWIDNDTQALLETLCESIASARLLLLVNYRPEYRHEWGGRSYYTQLRLDPLDLEGADQMLTALLGDAPELEPLKQAIAARTEGNPFFIEEIVQGLLEEGVLTGIGQLKLARPFLHTAIPTTVRAMLAARIDRLPREEKELLQTVAAIGREFSFRLARRIADLPESRVDSALAHLQTAEFIHEQPAPGDVEYIFKHALTQEVAYASLLNEQRKRLHERIAGAIELVFADRINDHLKDLAHHYCRSNNSLKAIEYLRRAGEQATVRAFYEEAIEQLKSALDLLEKLDNKVRSALELEIRIALTAPFVAVRSMTGSEGLRNAERVRELCEQAGDSRRLAWVLVNLFFFHYGPKSLVEAQPFATRALELAETSQGEYEIFCGSFLSGILAVTKGEYPGARQHFERALAISQETQDSIVASALVLGFLNCAGFLMQVWWVLGYPEQARHQLERLVELLRQRFPVFASVIGAMHLLTIRCQLLHDYQGARTLAREALDSSIQAGFSYGIVFQTIMLGTILVAEGEVEAGTEKLITEINSPDANWDRYTADWLVAGAYLDARRSAEGSAFVEQALAAVVATGRGRFEADLHRIKGEFIVMSGGALSEAEAAFNSAIKVARQQQARSFELRASLSLARLLAQQGRRDEARTMLAEIYNWFTEGFDTADLKDAKALLEELAE
jgi:class 3 adenylate cyclase/tetratricopeptide (TPR) repeat protein